MSAPRRQAKKPQYRPDGSFVSSSTPGDISGPGLWVTGVRGRERICVAETYDVLEGLVEELYPGAQVEYRKQKDAWKLAQGAAEGGEGAGAADGAKEVEMEEEEDMEKALKRELEGMKVKKKERTKKLANLIVNHQTNIDCIMFFSLLPPVDPVAITLRLLAKIQDTGFSGLRYVQRLTPASHSCPATLEDIVTLVQTKLYPPVFGQGKPLKFRVLHHSVHNASLDRDELIRTLATSVPQDQGHTVNLKEGEADVIISVRLLRNVASLCLLPGKEYVDLLKFNVPALTAKTRVEQSNQVEAAGAATASRSGAAVEAKKAGAAVAVACESVAEGMDGVEAGGS